MSLRWLLLLLPVNHVRFHFIIIAELLDIIVTLVLCKQLYEPRECQWI